MTILPVPMRKTHGWHVCTPVAPPETRAYIPPHNDRGFPPSLCSDRLFPPWKQQCFQPWLRSPLERGLIFSAIAICFAQCLGNAIACLQIMHGWHVQYGIAAAAAGRHSRVSRCDTRHLLLPWRLSQDPEPEPYPPPMAQGSRQKAYPPPTPTAPLSGPAPRVGPFLLPLRNPAPQACEKRMAGMWPRRLP